MIDEQHIERKPIKNCYVFAKCMEVRPDVCQALASLIIGEEIEIEGELLTEAVEDTVIARSVRFDARIKATGALIDIEMQASCEPNLAQRIAYYQSWLTSHALDKGKDFSQMLKRYVIFICDYDPFDANKPVYTIKRRVFDEAGTEECFFEDGEVDLVLNATGDLSLTTPQMAAMLEYVHTGKIDETNKVVVGMNEAIDKAYRDETWEHRVVTMDEERRRWKAEGRADGIAEGQSVERKREAALLQAMSAEGHEASEFLSALTNGDLDTLYREYGIE